MPLTSAAARSKDSRTAANGVKMEHRHYAFLAATIAGLQGKVSEDTVNLIADHFTKACRGTNPNFNGSRFLSACFGEE